MAAPLMQEDSTLQDADDSPSSDDGAPATKHKRTSEKSEREKRTYRACLRTANSLFGLTGCTDC